MGNRREFPFGLIDKLKINKIYYFRKKNYLPVPDPMLTRSNLTWRPSSTTQRPLMEMITQI